MQISTTARHCELDAKVRTFALQRLAKLQRFARDIQEAHLILTAEKFRHAVEITLHLKHHKMVSREQANTDHAAIELAAQRLEKQLQRLKDRRSGHKRPGRELPDLVVTEAELEAEAEPDLRSGTGN